jgi:hypothetical protein
MTDRNLSVHCSCSCHSPSFTGEHTVECQAARDSNHLHVLEAANPSTYGIAFHVGNDKFSNLGRRMP